MEKEYKLLEVKLLDDIAHLIEIDEIENFPELIQKLKILQKDLPYWIKDLEIVYNEWKPNKS
jgi:hypothetical protein